MTPLVIYHKGCMDGAGAALAAFLKFGEDAEYRAASYGDPPPTDDEVRGRDVYIVDFSYPRATLEHLNEVQRAASGTFDRAGAYEHGGNLVVLDHHKTAQKDCEGLSFCVFNMNKSGAMLAWEWFHVRDPRHPEHRQTYVPPSLFAYIQDRDLWHWQLDKSKEINSALFSTGATDDFRKLVPYFKNWNNSDLIRAGEAILRTETQMIARCVSTAEEVILDGHRCLAVSCPLLQSEVGEALAIESDARGGAPIGVVWHRHGKHKNYRVSLRSRDIRRSPDEDMRDDAFAPDVSAIAKKIGDNGTGGGHHKAAGFECSRLPWTEPL